MKKIIRPKKKNRFEKIQERKLKLEQSFAGVGSYIYRNITKGTLQLPKPNKQGIKEVEAGEVWEGDSYYMTLVKNNFATLVKDNNIKVVESKGETMEEKLILDQPDTVTTNGKVEHVIKDISDKKSTKVKKQENTENQDSVLLTDDPLSGIQILG